MTGKSRSAISRSCARRPRRRGFTASTTVRGNSSSAAAGRRSTATGPAFPRCSWRAARIRRGSTSIVRALAGRSNSRRSRSISAPIPSCSRTSSAPIRSTFPATATWISSSSGSEATCCSRAAPTARSRSPTTNGISTAIPAGRRRSPRNGSRGRNSRRWRSATMSIAARRVRPGAPARRIRSIARSPATSPTIRSARPSRPASARSRCCSPTGTSRACRRCGSPTTGNITAAARSRCGGSTRARRPASIPAPTAGGIFRSTAWASPRATSTAPATRNISSPRWATKSCRSSIPMAATAGRRPSIAISPARSGRRRIFPMRAATSGLRPPGTPNSPTSTTPDSSTSSSPRAISSRCPTSPLTIRAIF